MVNKKFTNPINRGRIVANKFEVTDVTGNEKIIKDIDSNVNVQGTKLDANFFTELQKGLVFTVDSVHSVESGVDIYTLAIDGLYGNSNATGFPLFPGLSLNVKIDISNTETASKIRISGSDYTFLTENGNTYTALNVGSLIENNYYKIIFNGNEFILSNTTKATETKAGTITEARVKEIAPQPDLTPYVPFSKGFRNQNSTDWFVRTNGEITWASDVLEMWDAENNRFTGAFHSNAHNAFYKTPNRNGGNWNRLIDEHDYNTLNARFNWVLVYNLNASVPVNAAITSVPSNWNEILIYFRVGSDNMRGTVTL